MHYYAIFMHNACVHAHAHMHALRGYTRQLCTCWYAAIQVNQPSGISQAAAIAVHHPQGVKLSVKQLLEKLNFFLTFDNNNNNNNEGILIALLHEYHSTLQQTKTTKQNNV